jgi:hypothetical protein
MVLILFDGVAQAEAFVCKKLTSLADRSQPFWQGAHLMVDVSDDFFKGGQ